MNKSSPIIIIVLIISVLLFQLFYIPENTEYTLNPYDISKTTEGNAKFISNTIQFEGNGTYGNKDLCAVIENLTSKSFSISFKVSSDEYAYGTHEILFNIGEFQFGLLNNALTGMGIVYGTKELKKYVPMFLGINKDYSIVFTINKTNLTYKVSFNIQGKEYSVRNNIDIGNFSMLMHGAMQSSFLIVKMQNSDTNTLTISNLEITLSKQHRSIPYVVIFSEITIIVIFSIILLTNNVDLYASIFFIFVIMLLFLTAGLNINSGITELILLMSYASIFGLMYYSLDSFYENTNSKELATYIMEATMLAIFVIVLLLISLGNAQSINKVEYTLNPVKHIIHNRGLYNMASSNKIPILLLLTGILLSIPNEYTKSLGIIIAVPSTLLVSYLFFQNILLSIGLSIFTMLSLILLNSHTFDLSRFTRTYLSIVLIAEIVIFGFILFFV